MYTTLAPLAATPWAQPVLLHTVTSASTSMRLTSGASTGRASRGLRRSGPMRCNGVVITSDRSNWGNVPPGSCTVVWMAASGKAACRASTTRSAPPRWVR